MTPFPVLENSRLVLDRIRSKDAAAIFDLFSDMAVVEYYDLEAFTTHRDAEQLLALFESRYKAGTGIRWAIRERGYDVLVGTCGFNSWSRKMHHGTIGFDLMPSHWRRGLATEAVSAMIQAAASGTLGCGVLHRIQADTVVGNVASEKVLTKLGFQEEGIRRQAAFLHGRYHDMKCFGLVLE